MSADYLQTHLKPGHPRLVLDAAAEKQIREKLKTDPVVQNLYRAIRFNAERILNEPLLERRMVGKRLLGTAREMLRRANMLGFVYRIEGDARMLECLDANLRAVCAFSDWNPRHFLDVAEMSLGVSLAIDWAGEALPVGTVDAALDALIEKGIQPSWEKNPGPFYRTNNWNQVCNGGMVAAAIAIAERDPELAAKTLHRALDGLPNALVHYGPDGAHPEASTYWDYATSYTVATIAMLETAFGTDFGISAYPGFMESAMFRVVMNAPSGWYYNFGDCGDRRSENGDLTLAWFAERTGDALFFERDRFLRDPESMGDLQREAGMALAWIAAFEETRRSRAPTAWAGHGLNPVVVFQDAGDDSRRFYFGGKGGSASISHANMDAGSFIFELDGVRWSIDPGKQDYNTIEQTGFDLWSKGQDGDRWRLLSKNNFGHSTLTINDQPHRVDGKGELIAFREGRYPSATFDLTPVFGGLAQQATRTFTRDSDASVLIEDDLALVDGAELVTWQMMTTAEVAFVPNGLLLRQDGRALRVENLSHPGVAFSVVSLNPPPLALDSRIPGLKRLELRLPAWTLDNGKTQIRIRLARD